MTTHRFTFTYKQAIRAFTPQPQSINAILAGTHFTVPRKVWAKSTWGGWLHTPLPK